MHVMHTPVSTQITQKDANQDDRELEHGLLIRTHTGVNSSVGTSHEATGNVLNHVELGFLPLPGKARNMIYLLGF